MSETSRRPKARPTAPRPAAGPPAINPSDDRPTEDERAQAALGGPKGDPELPGARMTPARAKKIPSTPGDGHTA